MRHRDPTASAHNADGPDGQSKQTPHRRFPEDLEVFDLWTALGIENNLTLRVLGPLISTHDQRIASRCTNFVYHRKNWWKIILYNVCFGWLKMFLCCFSAGYKPLQCSCYMLRCLSLRMTDYAKKVSAQLWSLSCKALLMIWKEKIFISWPCVISSFQRYLFIQSYY